MPKIILLSITLAVWFCLPIIAGIFGVNNAYIPHSNSLPLALFVMVVYFLGPLLIIRAINGKPKIKIDKSVQSKIGILLGLVFFGYFSLAGFYSGIPGWITRYIGEETKRTYTVAQFRENPWRKTRWACDYWLSFEEESGFLKERNCVPTHLYDGTQVGGRLTVRGKETWFGFLILGIQS